MACLVVWLYLAAPVGALAAPADLPPLAFLAERWRQHRQLTAAARSLSAAPAVPSLLAQGSASALPSVSWLQLWDELRKSQRLNCIIPACALSLLLSISELYAPLIRGRLFDAVLEPGIRLSALWPRIRLLTIVALFGWVTSIAIGVLFARARWQSSMSTRIRLMDAILRQEPAFYDMQAPGELASRLNSEPERLQELANRGPEKALNALLSIIGGAVLMIASEPRLAIAAILLKAPLLSRIAVLAGRTVGLFSALQQNALNRANALAAEALAQPHLVATLGARRAILDEYSSRIGEYLRVIDQTLFTETVLRYTTKLIESTTSLVILVGGLAAVRHGTLSLGSLTAFFAYAETFERGCNGLAELLNALLAARPSCARYFQLLGRPSTMDPEPRGGIRGADSPTPDQCSGEIELRRVSFRFGGRDADALHDVSLHIAPGETVAICGPSGSGKTTLAKLILRLYDPADGQVLLDGHDVRSLDLKWLRRQFGYVPQTPALFDETILHNLVLGLEQPPSQEQLWAALEDAGAMSFVRALPFGLQCRVGEGGSRLSGGQRQRLALARVFVRRPPIFVFDEATSSLDLQTERIVQLSIDRLNRQHAVLANSTHQNEDPYHPLPRKQSSQTSPTVVVIAHQLGTIARADKVVVLIDGRVAELGTPLELAQAGGWFEQNFYPRPGVMDGQGARSSGFEE